MNREELDGELMAGIFDIAPDRKPAIQVYSRYAFLRPNLGSADNLKNVLKIYLESAAKGDEAAARDFTSRAMLTKGALEDIYGLKYGVDYKVPGFYSP